MVTVARVVLMVGAKTGLEAGRERQRTAALEALACELGTRQPDGAVPEA